MTILSNLKSNFEIVIFCLKNYLNLINKLVEPKLVFYVVN